MDLGLAERTVVVTGASGGIGRALAAAFAAEGANLVLAAHRRGAELRDAVAGRDALVVDGNVADAAAVERWFEAAEERFGRVDVCVANAGIWPAAGVGLHEMPVARIRDVLDVNLLGSLLTARAFLASLARVPARAEGGAALVLVGSTAGRFGERGHAEYAASKAGLRGLLLTLKNEIVDHDPRGRVNLVEPGWTVTEMTRDQLGDDALVERVVATMALRRFASADDVAAAVLWLASPVAARHVTGEIVTVAGGMEGRLRWPPGETSARDVRRQSGVS